jgi:hypothetical protein
MLTLIVWLFLDFIHVQYKKKNKKLNKNILLINQRKDEKKNYKLFLITVHTQYILFNLLKIKLEL